MKHQWLQNRKPRVVAILLTVLIICISAPIHAKYYTIVDAVRDGNWWLKVIRETIMHHERMKHYEIAKKTDAELYKYRTEQEEAHSSAKIRAVTTALSQTHNLTSEPRYDPSLSKETICDAIRFHNSLNQSKELCVSNSTADEKNTLLINSAMNSEQVLAQDYFKHQAKALTEQAQSRTVNQRSGGQSDTTDNREAEKRFLEQFAFHAEEFGKISNNLVFITKEQNESAQKTIALIFGDGIKTHSPTEIARRGISNPQQFDDLSHSLLLGSLYSEMIQDKTMVDGKSNNALIAGALSPDQITAMTKDLTTATMNDQALRQYALMQARALSTTYAKLEKNLRMTIPKALALREK